MPNRPHRLKRLRQNVKRRALNNWRKRRIKASIREFLTHVQNQDAQSAEQAYRKTAGLIDKVACTSTLHKNTAARRKSRLARRLNELKAKTGAA